jgi:hypothetical protein
MLLAVSQWTHTTAQYTYKRDGNIHHEVKAATYKITVVTYPCYK